MEKTSKQERIFETIYGKVSKNSLSLAHPRFKARADRLDLITNSMVGIKATIGGKNFTVCDLSETGFSYAEKVPVKRNLSFKQVKIKVDQIAGSNHGKALKCLCFYEGQSERGGVETKGTIKNHVLFLVLTADEIKRTVTSYLQSKAIRRSHDPQGFFHKLDLILEHSNKMKREGCSESTLGIVMNTTFQNLILEIGAPVEVFDKLYQGFINRPVYVKYGVSVSEKKDAMNLLKFAKVKNAAFLHTGNAESNPAAKQRLELIKTLNQKYGFKDFVLVLWKNCLKHYDLNPDLLLPKIEKEKVAVILKEEKSRFDGALEKLADPEFIEGDSKGLEQFICDGLYWYLIEKDKKYFDREVIKKDIRIILTKSYADCLALESKRN